LNVLARNGPCVRALQRRAMNVLRFDLYGAWRNCAFPFYPQSDASDWGL